MLQLFILTAGLAILVLGGDALVRGAVAIAVRLNIPHLIIGLTIVAFGTSAPELLISIRAAFEGFPGLALGNVVGSNIANIWLVLGVPALISAICCNQNDIHRNLVFMWAISLALLGLLFYEPLKFWHGLLLVSLLFVFLIDCAMRTRSHRSAEKGDKALDEEVEELIEKAEEDASAPLGRSVLILLAGLVGLAIGAELTINAAVNIARTLGVSEATIGLTIVAIGTSLPELAATVMAALRSQPGLALGNAIGSNIYNIGGVLGVTALIAPIDVAPVFLKFDIWVMLAAALSIVPFILWRGKITRVVGLVFLVAYSLYIYKVMDLGRLPMIEQTERAAPMSQT